MSVVVIEKCHECGQMSPRWGMFEYAGQMFCSRMCRDDYAHFLTETFHPLKKKVEETLEDRFRQAGEPQPEEEETRSSWLGLSLLALFAILLVCGMAGIL